MKRSASQVLTPVFANSTATRSSKAVRESAPKRTALQLAHLRASSCAMKVYSPTVIDSLTEASSIRFCPHLMHRLMIE